MQIAAEKPGGDGISMPAPRCHLLINIAHIPRINGRRLGKRVALTIRQIAARFTLPSALY